LLLDLLAKFSHLLFEESLPCQFYYSKWNLYHIISEIFNFLLINKNYLIQFDLDCLLLASSSPFNVCYCRLFVVIYLCIL